MAARTHPPAPTTRPELVLTRTFEAPRSLVFKAWTDPRHVARWWGPHGFTNPVCAKRAAEIGRPSRCLQGR